MKFGKLSVIGLVMTGWVVVMAPALRAADEKPPTTAPAPRTYAEAVKQIQDRMKSIDTAIKAGKLKDIDPDAKVIITLSKSLGELALADGSGVPKDKVKEVNKASKDLAEMTDMCHDAADAGKADETKKHYDGMVKLVASISQNAPATQPVADPAPKTYAEAVKQIQDRMTSIDTAIKAGKLKDIDPDAKVIITLSQSLGELALADKSGVPKDKVKEVNQAAKDLAEMTDMCHDAADAGKADETKKHYDGMVKLVNTVSDYVKG